MEPTFQIASVALEMDEEDEVLVDADLASSEDLDLIALVRENSVLWNPSRQDYKNTELKSLTWEMVGANLKIPLSVSDDAKRFQSLRTVFARLDKKVRDSMPPSGSGAGVPEFQPTWPLYREMIFLKEVIKPRRTKSNFARPVGAAKKSKVFSLPSKSSVGTVGGPQTFFVMPQKMPVVSQSGTGPCTPQTSSSTAVPGTSSAPMRGTSTQSASSSASSCASSQAGVKTPVIRRLQVDPEEVKWLDDILDSDTESVSSAGRLRAGDQCATPPPDRFWKTRKQQESDSVKAMNDVAGVLKQLAGVVTATTPASSSAAPASSGFQNLSPSIQASLLLVRSALERVGESLHLQCAQEILTVLLRYQK